MPIFRGRRGGFRGFDLVVHAKAFAFDNHGLSVVQQSIEDCGGEGRVVVEDLVVGCQKYRANQVPQLGGPGVDPRSGGTFSAPCYLGKWLCGRALDPALVTVKR